MKNQFPKLAAVLFALLFSMQAAMAARLDVTVGTFQSLRSAISANAADITFTGSNTTDDYKFTSTGKEFLLVRNSHATDAGTVTVVSVADENGRTGDLPSAYSLAAGEFAIFGPYPMNGWRQTDGKIYVNTSIDEIGIKPIRLP